MDWTPPPRGSGREPDLNQVLNEVKQRLPKFNRPKGLWLVLLAVLAVLVGSGAYYTVGPEETGVVLRFGKYVRSTGPGIHAKIPLGVEQATRPGQQVDLERPLLVRGNQFQQVHRDAGGDFGARARRRRAVAKRRHARTVGTHRQPLRVRKGGRGEQDQA